MSNFSSKLFEVFKNLKSDAVPKAPRTNKSSKITIEDVTEEERPNDENINTSNEQDDTEAEPEVHPAQEKQKTKKNENVKTDSEYNPASNNSVNVQATGNVWNIVGSKGVHVGNVYHFKNTTPQPTSKPHTKNKINKTKDIENVMKAPMRVSHKYINYVSKNLGLEWQQFFRKLNYSQGRIETFILDAGPSGVTEARYQLLLDWSRNDEVGTLGKLASLLWEAEEKEVVQGLALIYKEHKDTK